MRILKINNFLRGRNQFAIEARPVTTDHPYPPPKGKGGGLGPLSTNGVEVGGQEKNEDTTCNAAWKTKDKESRHIEAGKKKLTTQSPKASIQLN